jgi:hypothetical protein
MSLLILHITQEYIVEHGNHVDIKHTIFQGNKVEINKLGRRPHEPVGDVDFEKFLLQELVGLCDFLAFEKVCGVEVMQDEHW